jgi:WS/DGAT/MGAT family acyltransferase
VPRPEPSETKLIIDEVRRRFRQPFAVLDAVRDSLSHPEEALEKVEETISAVVETLAPALRPASETPLNAEVGPSRRFDWMETSLEDVKAVKNSLGGTVNDVVLATVSGALRRFFQNRGLDPDELDVRAMVPVSVRRDDEHEVLGNRIAEMVADLPVDEPNPATRLDLVRATMSDLKESKQAVGAEVMTAIAEWTVPNLLVQAVRLAARSRPYNLVVTNVPGPQVPLYMLGCRMLTSYPVVPLFQNQTLVVGLFSYDGGLYWGLNADWETVPDLHEFVEALRDSFAELQKCAAKKRRRPAARKSRPRQQRASGA